VLHSSKLRFYWKQVRFKSESFIYHASLTVQWTPLLLVVSMFACENTHRVALSLFMMKFTLLILRHPFSLLCFLSAFITARGNSTRWIIVYVCNHFFCVSHKVIVAIPLRNPDWMFFVKSAKDLFRWGTGAIMTRCSQWQHQWSLCGVELRPVPTKQTL